MIVALSRLARDFVLGLYFSLFLLCRSMHLIDFSSYPRLYESSRFVVCLVVRSS